MLSRAVLIAAACLSALGCDPDPTYTREIAPILAEQCAGCHRAGGVAPFSLETYDDARVHADAIAAAVESGRMPPWPAEEEAGCPPFADSRDLPPDDISSIVEWARDGAPRGNGSDRTATPRTQARWLDGPTTRVEPPEPFTPSPDVDEYRCFVMDPGLTTDQYLTAYAVGDATGVHHLHLWSIDDDAAAEKALALDAADPGSGFACLESLEVPGRHLTVWGPTDPVRRHPEGTGMKLLAGKKLLMQIHYHHATEPGPFLELALAPTVEREAQIITVGPIPFVLPPRRPATTVGAMTVMPNDALLWGVRAHMHALGSKAKVTVTRNGGEACLLSIPRWDEKWQLMYFLEEPVPLLSGDILNIDCTYDTTAKTEETLFGPTANDEMCNANFFVTTR